jgi:AraC-like DNA-binding protein
MIVIKNGRVLYDSSRRVQDPINMVELAFQSGYKVSEMSKLLGISSRHLERMFYEALGVSPKYWLRQQRMIRARYLVREGFPLKHISVFLGFKRYSHFIAEVRAFYDMPPVQMVDLEKRRCTLEAAGSSSLAIAS